MIDNFRLRVFFAVAQRLNFSRAAEELLLSQPAVTQQIKALEEELGTALFDRSGGHIALTQAGLALLPYVERLKQLADEAVAAVAGVGGTDAGTLAIGASQTIAQYLLPRLIARFLDDYPRVRLTAISGNTDAMVDAMLKRKIDLALIEGPPMRKELRLEVFAKDRMVLAVPAGHAWAGQQIALAELKSQPLLVREFGSGSRRVMERAFGVAGLHARDLAIRMELDSTEALLSAVEAGLGVAFVSRWAVRRRLALGTLRLGKVTGLRMTRQLALVYPSGPDLTGAAAWFRTQLLTAFAERSVQKVAAREDRRNLIDEVDL